MKVDTIQRVAQQVVDNVQKVIIGKEREVQMALLALVCKGHVLIEDVPGVGKTMLAKALARSIGCTFSRIQFTPDLLPSDVTGVSIYNQKSMEFQFRPGPVIAQIILADEINRATPKTQSALLECMEERQVTVDGVTYPMPTPFIVLATQNPIEYEGTFPLPEAEIDRFLIRLSLGYPAVSDEMMILDAHQHSQPIDAIAQVVDAGELISIQQEVQDVYVDELIREYIVKCVEATRNHPDIYLGASPRGSLALFKTSQARAAFEGRDYVIPDDVKGLATSTLAHRLILNPSARMRNVTPGEIIEEILDTVPVPGARVRR